MNPALLNLDLDSDLSLAAVLKKVGNVPPERVLMYPTPGTATEEDVIWFGSRATKRLCELIDGILVEKAMGLPEPMFAFHVGSKINAVVVSKNLGFVASADGLVWIMSGRIRIPDAAFFSWERLPNRAWPTEPISGLSPNLAIEVRSPSNTDEEFRLKRLDYFGSGVELVWEFDHRKRTVRVDRSAEGEPQHLQGNDVLDAGSVIPGFAMPLSELFAVLDRRG